MYFYLHSRLLERAARVSDEYGGGRYREADHRNNRPGRLDYIPTK